MWIPRSRAEEATRERLASTTWATRTTSTNLENPASSIPEASLKLEPWVVRWKSLARYNRWRPPWVTDAGSGHIRTPPAISLLPEAATASSRRNTSFGSRMEDEWGAIGELEAMAEGEEDEDGENYNKKWWRRRHRTMELQKRSVFPVRTSFFTSWLSRDTII